ncbi:glycogen phosphorylase [Rodentibacter pneumotropicus]|uniref:Glycogen phosphorylase n=1 Tax=Rodentibacter pneumotropicus TaxID=758 RepID=A0A448MSK2_9PAST|nr:glycogen phosphorylase [Rodentibacter pneumotropicus]
MEQLRRDGYHPFDYYQNDEALRTVVDQVIAGVFSPEEPQRYLSLLQGLQYYDYYQVFADFHSYVEAQN